VKTGPAIRPRAGCGGLWGARLEGTDEGERRAKAGQKQGESRVKTGREQRESRAKEERGRECACVIGQQYAAGGA